MTQLPDPTNLETRGFATYQTGGLLPRRRYESWVVISHKGEVRERMLRRHWTRRAAQRWSESCSSSIAVLGSALDLAMHTGVFPSIKAEARERPT